MHPITTVDELEDRLSEPTPGVLEALARLDGDLVVLGAGGKMGPSLARMARRAFDAAGTRHRVIAASRFGAGQAEAYLRAHDIETIRCDLLDPEQLRQLPEASNVIFMAGRKFGSTGQEALTWAMNAYLPGMVCQKFRHSRIVAFSTGNVYGLTPVALGGSVEDDLPRPIGEYAMSALGRERIFEHFSRQYGIPLVLLRLNYATELRYGVLVDVARRVFTDQPIDLEMGHLNAIWQGDANAAALQAFTLTACPPRVLNIAGPELLGVRRLAEQFGRLFGKNVSFRGSEASEAFLSNAQAAHRHFGKARVSAVQMVEWIAAWVQAGGEHLDKPTQFEVRDGSY